MKKLTNISLLLLTKNESENLKNNFKWLDECKTINEIIVIDDNSTDDTVETAKKLNSKNRTVKVFNRGLDGDFAYQRNFGISKTSNDLVFWLDDNWLQFALEHLWWHRQEELLLRKLGEPSQLHS